MPAWRESGRDPVLIGLFSVLVASAVYEAHTRHEHAIAGIWMALAGLAAGYALVTQWNSRPRWALAVGLFAAGILFFDGLQYMAPDDCSFGPAKIILDAIGFLYGSFMSATRVLPLFASLLAGTLMLVKPATRRPGVWTVLSAATVILVDQQLHYVASPSHCLVFH